MDTLKEFLSDLKDRLTNPLISSFVVAWLISNWKFLIVLFYFKPNSPNYSGIAGYISYLQSKTTFCSLLIWPLIVCIFYTFVFPSIRAYIKLMHAKVIARNDTDILAVTKDGTMPVSRYIKLQDEQRDIIERLEILVGKELETLAENATLKTELLDKQREVIESLEKYDKVSNKLQKYSSLSDVRLLDGRWNVQYTFRDGRTENSIWEFEGNTLNRLSINKTYVIKEIIVNPIKNELSLYLRELLDGQLIDGTSYFLKFNNDISEMEAKNSTLEKLDLNALFLKRDNSTAIIIPSSIV